MISYAQFPEDVVLNRALGNLKNGFYIDIGAYHPDRDSVTRHFYDLGWHGINIEPGNLHFPEFERLRPRDINLKVAVSDHIGEATFFEMDQVSTLETRYAHNHRSHQTGEYTVPVTTIAQICRDYAPKDIHFLKIDVEGHEAAVLRGADFKEFRPWILVIEAKEPNRIDVSTHHEWEDLVLSADYCFAYSDPVNRYYVAQERRSMARFFTNPIDDYVRAADIWARMALESRIIELENLLKERDGHTA